MLTRLSDSERSHVRSLLSIAIATSRQAGHAFVSGTSTPLADSWCLRLKTSIEELERLRLELATGEDRIRDRERLALVPDRKSLAAGAA